VTLAIPLSAAPHQLGWTSIESLPKSSVVARFFIWSYSAEKALEALPLGIGLNASRTLDEGPVDLAREPGPGHHPHNAYLEIWLELGVIGPALFLALGLFLLARLRSLAPDVERYGLAAFASACCVLASGFSVWQAWQYAAIIAAVSVFVLSLRACGLSPRSPPCYT
jgi:exopolysaccharide production protein ExoQ